MSWAGAAVLTVAVLLVNCAVPPGQPVALDSAALSPDGAVVRVSVIGPHAPAPGSPCSASYSIAHQVDNGVIDVRVFMHDFQPGSCNLSEQICCEHEFNVELAAPSSVHAVRSQDRLSSIFLFAPPGPLVQLMEIPNGWTLQSEESEWNATGRWIRLYSQHHDSRPGTTETLELRQTFGGPEGSEPEYRQDVMVNGAPTNLHVWPEGEIQLDWLVGEDTIALFGNQADFSAADLIALAESAQVAD